MTRRAGSVIVYSGKRGRVFRLRYRDANGERVLETLGSEADGWTKTRAEEELRDRLVDVKRDRRRKIQPVAFEDFARQWLETYTAARGLKRSTADSYRTIVEHLVSALGDVRLEFVDLDHVESYVAAKRKGGLGPATINRHLNVLNLIFTSAIKRGAVRPNVNPVPLVERPKEPRRKWTILTPAEIARVANAFVELAREAPIKRETGAPLERAWIEQARVVFLVVVACGLRRGEVLGLRWRSVDLVDMLIRVEETFVRGQIDTPKSEAGERSIALVQLIGEELIEHKGRSAFEGDDELVFCHPAKGTTLDHKLYAETLRLALKRAKVTRPMRPFHDGRHSAITNDAASGNAPLAIMQRAGHSDFKTTQRYIDLAGVSFRDEADRLGARLFGERSGKSAGKSEAEERPRERRSDR